MLISPAYAQATGMDPATIFQNPLVPLIFVFVIFYFLLIRPQSKRAKERKVMIDNVRRGNRILTAGGLLGTVAKVIPDSQELEVDIAENVRVRIMRDGVSTVLTKPEPVSADKAGDKSDEKKN